MHVPHGPREAAAMAAWGRGKGEHHGGHKERAGRTDYRLRYFPSTFGGAVFCVRRPVASTVRTPGQRRERCTAGGAIALPSLCRFRNTHYRRPSAFGISAAAAGPDGDAGLARGGARAGRCRRLGALQRRQGADASPAPLLLLHATQGVLAPTQRHAVLLTRRSRSRCGIVFARRRQAVPTRLLRFRARNVRTPCSIIPTCMLAFMISSTSTITHFCNMYTLLILLCNAAGLPMGRAVPESDGPAGSNAVSPEC